MARGTDDFFSRSKRLILETAILIIFTVSLIEYVWYKLGPIFWRLIDGLG